MSLAGTVTSSRHANLEGAAVWMVVSAVVAAVAASPATAAGLGSAAGILYSAGDVGTKAAVSGGFHFWFLPALLACHGLAFVALQLAFQRGSALTSAGLATLWTNALPIVAGMAVFGEPLPGGALGVARIAAFVAVVAGAALLTRPGEGAAVARVAAGSVTALMLFACVGSVRAQTPVLPNFTLFDTGPAGGTVWTGRLPNPFVPTDRRNAYLYLPPGFSPDKRYPVLYLLHGFWGDPSSFVLGLHITQIADQTISSGKARPFIAVMPPGGPPSGSKSERAKGEWAGPSEDYIVRTVVPWADAHLPTLRNPRMRAIAGVSAGAFGAVDMALRHVGLFRTAESWEGYFQPFLDGPFEHASAATLAAHNPTLLARKETRLGPAARRPLLPVHGREPRRRQAQLDVRVRP